MQVFKNKTVLGLNLQAVAIFVCGLIIFTFGLAHYYKTFAINSDDVAEKVWLHQATGSNDIWLPADHYILKAPVNLLVDTLVHSPSKNIYATAWLMNFIGLLLFFLVAIYFINKYVGQKIKQAFYISFIWLCAVNGGFIIALASPQYRNMEIGLAFGFLWFIDRFINPLKWPKLKFNNLLIPLAGAVALGLFIFSDPAFLVFLVGPLIIAAGIYFLITQNYKTYLPLIGFILSGFVFYEIFKKLFYLAGFKTYGVPAYFVSWEKLGTNISSLIQSTLFLHNASFLGHAVFKASTIIILLNFVILLAVLASPLAFFRQKKFWLTFVAIQPIFLLITFVLSATVYPNTTSTRYLVLLPFYGAILLALVIGSLDKFFQRLAIALLVTASLGNFLWTSKKVVVARHENPNSYNQKIADLVRGRGLKKGYAPYWNAGITAFLSNFNAEVFSITYSNNKQDITPYYINFDVGMLNKPADESFIIVSNYPGSSPESQTELQAQYSTYGVFKAESAVRQFGKPKEILKASDFTSIYIYDYDLLYKIPRRANFQDAQQ